MYAFDDVLEIVSRVQLQGVFKGMHFWADARGSLHHRGASFSLFLEWKVPDRRTKEEIPLVCSRILNLPLDQDKLLYEMMRLAASTAEHELLESFRFKGVLVFDPHV